MPDVREPLWNVIVGCLSRPGGVPRKTPCCRGSPYSSRPIPEPMLGGSEPGGGMNFEAVHTILHPEVWLGREWEVRVPTLDWPPLTL